MEFLKKFKILSLFLSIFAIFSFSSLLKIEEKNEINEINDKIVFTSNYYAILEIPKINLKKEIYSLNDTKNNINKNLLLHKKSVMPGNQKSNIIIAGHSGTSSIAYFKNLYKLNINDIVKFYYNDFIYTYEIKDIEHQNKTGTLSLKEEFSNQITLITCTKNDNTKQTIYYAKLQNQEKIVKK